MTEVRHDDGVYEYRCLVGHRYAPRTLLASHSEAEEKALWAAVVALEEASNLVAAVAPQLDKAVADRLRAQADQRLKLAAEIRGILQRLEAFKTE